MFGLHARNRHAFYPYLLTGLSLLLLLMMGGCQSAEDFNEPQLHLVNIEAEEFKLLEQKFVLHLQVSNPNNQPFALHRVSYRLWLNNLEIGSGQLDKRVSVPAQDSRVLQVPLRTNIWQHLKPLSAALKNSQQPLQYRLEGKIKTGWLFGSNLHFNNQGEIIPADYLPEI